MQRAPATRVKSNSAPEQTRSRKWTRKRAFKSAFLILWGVIAAVIAAGSLYFWTKLEQANAMVPQLPSIIQKTITGPSEILASDGSVLFRVAAEFREPVAYGDIPQHVIDATLAAEDKRFFSHDGVDSIAMMRVLWVTAASGRSTQGGSTITMQLAKRVFSGSEKTLERKVQDISLALMMERSMSKEQILGLYLNQVFYGNGAYGISAAADVYFGKSLKDLTIGEAALLSRLVRRPSQENPFRNPEIAKTNRDVVLGIMLEEKFITKAEYDKAIKEPIKLAKSAKIEVNRDKKFPFFVDYVLAELDKKYPDIDLARGGYRVETTLDPKIQTIVDAEIKNTINRYRRLRVTTAAFLVVDKSGRIVGMCGGGNYERNQFNVASQGRRQPGSAFKPFVYAAGFETGALSPDGTVSNDPYYIKVGGLRKKVSGGGSGGRVSVSSALAASINSPAMWAIEEVGARNVVKYAKSTFGFTNELPAVPSLALGTGEVSMLEMAGGYSVFQSGGDRYTPYGIVRIVGPDGTTLARSSGQKFNRVMSTASATGMDALLRTVVTSGTAKAASYVVNARGKTGTTNSHKDAWFAGYTDQYIGIGWIGNDVPNPSGNPPFVSGTMAGVFGGEVTAPMWARIMSKVQDIYPEPRRQIRAIGRVIEEPDEEEEEEDTTHIDADDNVRTTPENTDPVVAPRINEGNTESGTTGSTGGGDGLTVEPVKDPPTNDPPKTKPKDPPAQGGGDGGGDLISVEVCADSSARASVYCPERRRIKVPRDQAPRGRCPLHGPH